jgi:Fe-S-cluster containining protein
MPKVDPCQECGGKCCRYFALQIDKPETRRDFDDIRWYLCHEHTKVFVEDGDWYLEVKTLCRHLDEDNRCRIYRQRPRICRTHATKNCEGTDAEFDREHEFEDDAELLAFMRKRFKSKKKKDKKRKKK